MTFEQIEKMSEYQNCSEYHKGVIAGLSYALNDVSTYIELGCSDESLPDIKGKLERWINFILKQNDNQI